MRCPKCGYNSFDHLDNCKKCGKDLVEHKQKYGIVSVLFPGQMKPFEASDTGVENESIAEEVVAAAAATAAVGTVAGEAMSEEPEASLDDPVATESSEGDDFGFDFMGDSEEEEDLSFDELFEEAPADEDVEETLPSPEQEAAKTEGDEFAFEPATEEAASESELEDDFGFDPAETEDDSEAEDFELPPAEKDDFSFDSDEEDLAEEPEGTEEDPKDPFELPESSQEEGAPEDQAVFSVPETVPDSFDLEENDLSLAESLFSDDEEGNVEGAELADRQPESIIEAALEEPLADSFFAEAARAGQDPSKQEAGSDSPPLPSDFSAFAAEELTADDRPAEDNLSRHDPEEIEVKETGLPASGVVATSVGAVMAAEQLSEESEIPNEKLEETGSAVSPIDRELLPQTGSRVAAFCLDLLLLAVVGASFVIAAEAAMSPADDSWLPSLETLIDLSVPYFLVLFSLAFGYFTLFHFLAGQTPGKMLSGLRVETLEGEPLIFSQAFLRSVGGLLQVLPAGLGYFAILSSPDRRGWNDRIAGTRLISLKGLPDEA